MMRTFKALLVVAMVFVFSYSLLSYAQAEGESGVLDLTSIFSILYRAKEGTATYYISDDISIQVAGEGVKTQELKTLEFKSVKGYVDFSLMDWCNEEPSRWKYMDNLVNIFNIDIEIQSIDNQIQIRCPVVRDTSKYFEYPILWTNPDRSFIVAEDDKPGDKSIFRLKIAKVALDVNLAFDKNGKKSSIPYLYFYIQRENLSKIPANPVDKDDFEQLMSIIDKVELSLPKASYLWENANFDK